MPNRSPKEVLAIFRGLTLLQSDDQITQLLNELAHVSKPTVVSFVNAHAVNLAWTNSEFRDCLKSSDLLLRDGKGMEIALERLGELPGLNLNGTDLIPKLLELYRGKSVALFGTEEPYLSRSAGVIKERFGVNIIALDHGFLESEAYLSQATSCRPDLILLAMGMPKQEKVSLLLRSKLSHPCLIVNGGAILDYLSERVQRAPLWMRNCGLEWLFRLCLEPRRLFKRYVLGNALFLYRLRALKAASH